jgi:hypothetical protein
MVPTSTGQMAMAFCPFRGQVDDAIAHSRGHLGRGLLVNEHILTYDSFKPNVLHRRCLRWLQGRESNVDVRYTRSMLAAMRSFLNMASMIIL